MKIYVFDISSERGWFNVGGAVPLKQEMLKIPSRDDLLIVHFTDYRNYREGHTYQKGKNQPYILWVSGGEPEIIGGQKQHWYQERLEHKIDENHQFFAILKSFIDRLKTGVCDWSLLYPKGETTAAQRLRSEILTPLVLLHLGLQMAAQDKRGKSNKLSPEEIESCRKGVALLKNNKFEIEKALYELMGVPYPGKGDCPEPLTQLQKWVDDNNAELGQLFEQAVSGKKFKRLAEQKLNGVLTAIEGLSEIVDRAADYGEQVKKNSSMRHFLKNAVPRLTHYFTDLNKEMCLALDLEMKDIESSFRTFLAPSPGYGLDAETKRISDKVLASVTTFRAQLGKEDNEQNLLDELKGLVDQLEVIEKLTLNSPEANLS